MIVFLIGTLNVLLRVRSLVNTLMWTKSGHQGPNWEKAFVDIRPSGPFQVKSYISMHTSHNTFVQACCLISNNSLFIVRDVWKDHKAFFFLYLSCPCICLVTGETCAMRDVLIRGRRTKMHISCD